MLSTLPQYVVQQGTHVKGSCVYRHPLHCDAGVHRGAGGRRNADALCDSKGVFGLHSFSLAERLRKQGCLFFYKPVGELLTRELRRAEPEEHVGAAGAEEVQQVLEAAYGAPRDKVSRASSGVLHMAAASSEKGAWSFVGGLLAALEGWHARHWA